MAAAAAAVPAASPYTYRKVENIKQEDYFDVLVQKGQAAYNASIGDLNQVAQTIKEHTARWNTRNLTLVAGTVTQTQTDELERDKVTYSLEREKREKARKIITELEEIITECTPIQETPDVQAYKTQQARLKIDLSSAETAHNDTFVRDRNDLVAKKEAMAKVLADIEAVWTPFRVSFDEFGKHCKGYTGLTGGVAYQLQRLQSGTWTPLALAMAKEQDARNAELTGK